MNQKDKRDELTVDGFSRFERMFIIKLSYVTMALSVFGLLVNLFLEFSLLLVLFPIFIFLAFGSVLLWAKKASNLFFLKLFLTVLTFFIVDFFWFWNFGSHGPAPYFFIIIYSFLVFIWHGRGLLIVSSMVIINILIVYLIDFFYPDLIGDYENPIARITDVYSGLAMYGILIFFLMNNSKTYLINEYIKAKESDRLKSAFLANLSHEIRTPMNAIIGFSQMLDDPELSVKNRSFYVETINSQGEKLMALINDIIDIAMIEAETITLNQEEVNIFKIIKDQIQQNKSKCKVGVELTFDDFDDMEHALVISDKTRLTQIINNLISNALKFTNQGKIEISLKHPLENKICIVVKDTGLGIPKEEFEKIFRSFYQIELTDINKLYEGTGIGLSLVKAIVEKMGGQITLTSTPGLGSEFKVHLPIKIVRSQPDNIQISESSSKSTKPALLIVEETKLNYLFKKEMFEKLNCTTFEVKNLKEAIDFLMNEANISFLVFDLKLPEFTEYELIDRIKTLFPEICIIAQHSNAVVKDTLKQQLPLIDHFVMKPFHPDVLKEILDKA